MSAILFVVMLFGGVPTSTSMEFNSIQACLRAEHAIQHDFREKGMSASLLYTHCQRKG